MHDGDGATVGGAHGTVDGPHGTVGGPLGTAPGRLERALAAWWSGPRPDVPIALYLAVWAAVVAAVWIGVGELLTHALRHTPLAAFDRATERWLALHRDRPLNDVSRVASGFASTAVIVAAGVALAAAAGATWRRWREPGMILIALIGEVTIFLAITAVVDRPRPAVPRLDRAPPTSSFPSGHTAAAAVLLGALALVTHERFRAAAVRRLALLLAVVAPALVAASRMYRGMHYPSDVVAGAGLGALWLVVSLRAVRMGVYHRATRGSAPPAPAT